MKIIMNPYGLSAFIYLIWLSTCLVHSAGLEPEVKSDASIWFKNIDLGFKVRAVGPANQDDIQALMASVDRTPRKETGSRVDKVDRSTMVTSLEEFVRTRPNSPYAASVYNVLGSFYDGSGRFSRAAENWEKAWNQTSFYTEGPGKVIADTALVNWATSVGRLGTLNEFGNILTLGKNREFSSMAAAGAWDRAHEKYHRLLLRPDVYLRCGVFALRRVAAVRELSYDDRGLLQEKSSEAGLTMQDMLGLSDKYALDLVAVRRTAPRQIPVPSVAHHVSNHYLSILQEENGSYLVKDPLRSGYFKLTPEELNEELSGYFLVPTGMPKAGYRDLRGEERTEVFGKGSVCPAENREDGLVCFKPGSHHSNPDHGSLGINPLSGEDIGDSGCFGCGAGGSGFLKQATSSTGGHVGMAQWRISEPYLNLWIEDTPLFYSPSKGPAIELSLGHRQRLGGSIGAHIDTAFGSNFGEGWHASWLSFVTGSTLESSSSFHAGVYFPGGRYAGKYSFSSPNPSSSHSLFSNGNSSTEAPDNTILEWLKNGTGYVVHFPDKSRIEYTHFSGGTYYLMTRQVDADGHATLFEYGITDPSNPNRLDQITDADGNKIYLEYNVPNDDDDKVVSRVYDAFGREVKFTYKKILDSRIYFTLSSIEDPEGILSSMLYDSYTRVTQLTTPYGSTSFSYSTFESDPLIDFDRWVKITDAIGTQVYVYSDESPDGSFPTNFAGHTLPIAPAPASFDTTGRHERNSFYWNREQWNTVTQTNLANMTWSDFKKARIRHWLLNSDDHPEAIGHEQAPSPDGSTEGHILWYDYDTTTAGQFLITPWLPQTVATVVPETGVTSYVQYQRNAIGSVTKETSNYGVGTTTRSRDFTYTANGGVFLTGATDFDGNLILTNAYTSLIITNTYGSGGSQFNTYATNHFLQTSTRYSSSTSPETTSFTYTPDHKLASITVATGLTITNVYGVDGYLKNVTNLFTGDFQSFTWTNNNIRTHTDSRGLTRTFTMDKLNRLVQTHYDSDGTSEYIDYTDDSSGMELLQPTKITDRLGNTNYLYYNAIGNPVNIVDPLNRTTHYEYCDCGALESVARAYNTSEEQKVNFEYDKQGRRTKVTYDQSNPLQVTSFAYNAIGQLTYVTNHIGTTTNVFSGQYNQQGLLTGISGPSGNLYNAVYDKNNRVKQSTDANGVTVGLGYDFLGRVITKTNDNGGIERFSHSAKGMTTYTNQLNKVWTYDYDPLRRLTEMNTPKNDLVSLEYWPGGAIKRLVDGRQKETRWEYDSEGYLTNKLDHLSQSILQQTFDSNGRVLSIWTPGKGSAAYNYDAVGNVTNINYSGSTPDLAYQYDSLNRVTNMVDGLGQTAFTYTKGGQIESENGPWDNDTVTYGFNESGLLSQLTVEMAAGGGGGGLPPGANLELGDAVDNTEFPFYTSGSQLWFRQTSVYTMDGDAAKSGPITHNQTSTLKATVTGPGFLNYSYKVSSEQNYDYLKVYVDGSQISSASGLVGWTGASTYIASGEHTVEWIYSKDGSVSSNDDAAYVDAISFTPDGGGGGGGGNQFIAEAVDNTDLVWNTGGDTTWYNQTSYYVEDGDAARNSGITHNQSTYISTSVDGPGTLTFYWKVSSEGNYDYLRFYIDSFEEEKISGEQNWSQRTYTIPTGSHDLKWFYTKDSSVDSGMDAGFVDFVTYTPAGGGGGSSGPVWEQSYAYDASMRLDSISLNGGSHLFDYQYSPSIGGVTQTASSLWKKIVFPNSSYVERTFDSVGWLEKTELKSSTSQLLNLHDYTGQVDLAGLIQKQTMVDGNYWLYDYFDDGQLESAVGHEPNATVRPHENYLYHYDAGGNLINRTHGQNQVSFVLDDLNQLQSASRTSSNLTVSGAITGTAQSVDVNLGNATINQDDTFQRSGITLGSGELTLRAEATNAAGDTTAHRVDVDLPSLVGFAYDDNGNLITAANRSFEYDAENQLIRVTQLDEWKVEFDYDGFGRRRVRRDYTWTGSIWLLDQERRYIYDGMQVVQERDETNLPLVTYVRGLDLSGSLNGAGGIGGLLAYVDHSTGTDRFAYYHTDAGGNVTAMVNQHEQVVARYMYSPYGELLGLSGPLAEANPYRFSSKEFHPRSGLYYYGFRFYDPSLGRWLNQDPLGEAGGLNLYGFVGNNPNYFVDTDGRAAWGWVARGGWAIGVWAGKSYLFDKYVQPHIDDVVVAIDNWNSHAGAAVGVVNDAHQLLSLRKQLKNLTKLGCSIAPKTGGTRGYRYVAEGEVQAIKDTGKLRGGNPGDTFFTKDVYKSGEKAQQRLSLPSRPTHRVEFEINNNPNLGRNGTKVDANYGQPGKGSEFMTTDPVEVNLINVQPLR